MNYRENNMKFPNYGKETTSLKRDHRPYTFRPIILHDTHQPRDSCKINQNVNGHCHAMLNIFKFRNTEKLALVCAYAFLFKQSLQISHSLCSLYALFYEVLNVRSH